MSADFLRDVFREFASGEAIVDRDVSHDYGWLLRACAEATQHAASAGLRPGGVASLEADFSASSIAQLIALFQGGAIAVPLLPGPEPRADRLLALAQVEWRLRDQAGNIGIQRTARSADHELYRQLRSDGHAGLVLFTSGYTGDAKAVVHDCERLMEKYRTRRHRLRTLMFLLFDHIGGIDTLFQALANGSTVVIPRERTPEAVCETIARHRVEVLPASPTFLTMLLLSEAHRRHDLSSLRYITYGAEVMPQSTLDKLAEAFPGVTLLQKYGLSELGTLRSRSRANDSLWLKVGGEGFETRVVDGMLEVKAHSSMLGYLNAPSPITPDGWFKTGDAVEQDGEYLRILGRATDLINVGGRKVYPGEVEGIIQGIPNIAEVAVFGEPNPFTGQVVVARVALRSAEDPAEVEQRVRAHCRAYLEPYKVPAKVMVTTGALHSEREKMLRR